MELKSIPTSGFRRVFEAPPSTVRMSAAPFVPTVMYDQRSRGTISRETRGVVGQQRAVRFPHIIGRTYVKCPVGSILTRIRESGAVPPRMGMS